MALTGNRDSRDIVVNTGVDATTLQKYAIASGMTYAQIVALMQAGLAGVANEVMSDPVIADLVYVTDAPEVKYRMGTNGAMEQFSEYSVANMQRAEHDGHMLPLIPYDRGLGWTWYYLRNAIEDDVRADIISAMNSVRDRFRISVLTRALKRTDDSGAALGLGSSGYSPGWATTAASTSVDFTPPDYNGVTFASTHEHYKAEAGSGTPTLTYVQAMRDHLREHGHKPPYTMYICTGDRATYEAMTGFVYARNNRVAQYALTATVSNLDAAEGWIGSIADFDVKVVDGMPSNYYSIGFKSYGRNSPLNPLRIRIPKGTNGVNMEIRTRNASPADPLNDLYIFTEFGVGVNDRTAGITLYDNSGTWADGTPT